MKIYFNISLPYEIVVPPLSTDTKKKVQRLVGSESVFEPHTHKHYILRQRTFLLAYACCILVVHRPLATVLHVVQLCVIRSRTCHQYPSISISAIKSLLRVFLGLPLPRFPWGFHCRSCLVMLCFGFLSVFPIHLHFLLGRQDTVLILSIYVRVCSDIYTDDIWHLFS